ncbi:MULTISPECIES: universal stress protein [Actinomadura]|jgi:nucleotide-binding universal stress UspA family protein|uniref:Nucleotide-binding universal stress UspA family protein n=1 Tax=Actinomadura citrea TaxID=46158 RepID=A0A7Y9GAN1_9ACTN|nr:universal stress protein [Actinomadura citrea]NYE13007.1 nucleotide-binding universal stress UspA family protein [Actinomadura citrea]GGT89121.1 universal stress protein [Actinomadura citrea]
MSHVVVGYDGTSESERALRWAVEEARLRRVPLTVCHAWRWPYPVGHIDREGVTIVRRMAEHMLDHGVALAHDLAPALKVRRRLATGGPSGALLNEGPDAELIVIGSHPPEEMHVGSTALRVPARADRPVAVVRSAAPRDGLVVVGVDGSPGADAALAFGFEEAVLRGWRLRAVYGCWEPGAVPDGDLSLFDDEDKLRHVCGAVLERAVAPWLVKNPFVQATTSLVLRSPREALLEAAEEATLTVVGARGTGAVRPLTLGATSDALLKHAPCTVTIVPQWFG